MCRLFAFRSVVASQVHRSMMEADNALLHQSNFHPDGWGVAYYVAGAPHLIKSTSAAVECSLFQKVSGILASKTVIAHIRKATQGELCITNAHPFQYGKWIFAHNGNIANFEEHRQALIDQISPKMSRFILGNTDSEVFFYLLLTQLARRVDLHRKGCSFDDLAKACLETVEMVTDMVGPIHPHDNGPPDKTYLSFIITNGTTMIAHQGGKNLYYSTYKSRCSERSSCPHLAPECEAPTQTGYVNHLIFTSEKISGENEWQELEAGGILGVDWTMRLQTFSLASK